jgi:glycosyltransferase involved in cell wall biosynthesis
MSTEQIRALHIVANLERGGGQEVVRTLVRYLPEAGVSPVVVALADGPLRGEIEGLGIPVEIITGRRHSVSSGLGALYELRRIHADLARVIARHRPQVVQTHLLRSLDFVVLSLRREPGVRAVFWTVHNALLDLRADQLPGQRWLLGPKRAGHRLLYRAGGRLVDGFIAVSSDVGNSVRAAYRPPNDRLTVIPNGVDTERYAVSIDRREVRVRAGLPVDGPLAIVVAKLMEQKGHAVYLDALPGVLERVPGLHTAFVGDGALRDVLRARAARLGVAGKVSFLGSRDDVPALLSASDLFVLPSLWEGLPMALLEAMASRLPVVATSVSGTREVVEPDRSGVLIAPGRADMLAAAMAEVLRDGERADALGAAARLRVEDWYSARTQALRHARLYRTRMAMTEGD